MNRLIFIIALADYILFTSIKNILLDFTKLFKKNKIYNIIIAIERYHKKSKQFFEQICTKQIFFFFK